ncbi:hypothetical protein [Phenylobacterium sp.]|uniref:hypothetical protein n=1 Tax=Phenylobacterium sp. TaxID=1871053 RepID=UPI002B825596|nr:hypothetical protein [Phenylobacterium sp.]HVI32552.1 hypothetical protein [Phenylobacterium sp.]
MMSAFPVRRTLSFVALAAAVVLTACAEPPAPAPPPPPPAAALSPKVIEQAAAYRAYVTRAQSISPMFTNGASVAEGVRVGAAYEPQQMVRGAIAYGAVAAMQDQAFVAGVRTYAGDAEQRRTIAYEIMKDPAYVIGIQGSASAAGQVIAALGGDGQKLLEQGRLVKQAAYDVQRSSWSKAEVADRVARLAYAKQASVTPVMGDMAETTRLQSAAVGAAPLGLTAQTAAPPYTPVVIRAMAVAALANLGYGDDASLQQVMPLLADPTSASCLNMSKLNLYQCLAVSKPHYEDVFCLGQHVLIDTGKCLIKGAGLPEPTDGRINIAASATPAPVAAERSLGTTTRTR